MNTDYIHLSEVSTDIEAQFKGASVATEPSAQGWNVVVTVNKREVAFYDVPISLRPDEVDLIMQDVFKAAG